MEKESEALSSIPCKISIVTVCFNSAGTIERTIQSVINQSYKNIDYIIIDGGSTDGTVDIIKKYEPCLSYWVSEPDKGIYDAMNKGIKAATGELIAFINSDDWYDKDAILHFAKAYAMEPADVLYGDLVYIREGNTQEYHSNAKVVLEKLIYLNIFCHQAICVKTSLMKSHFFDLSYKIAADYEFLSYLFINDCKFNYIGNHVVAYFNLGGLSSTNHRDTINEICDIAERNVLHYYDTELDGDKVAWLKRRIYHYRFYGIQRQLFQDIKSGNNSVTRLSFLRRFKYVIYGAGFIGKQISDLLSEHNIEVCFFIDGNEIQWDKEVSGKKIYSPASVTRNSDTKIIISSYEYSDNMAAKLTENGLRENKDFFRYETWVEWLSHRTVSNVESKK